VIAADGLSRDPQKVEKVKKKLILFKNLKYFLIKLF